MAKQKAKKTGVSSKSSQKDPKNFESSNRNGEISGSEYKKAFPRRPRSDKGVLGQLSKCGSVHILDGLAGIFPSIWAETNRDIDRAPWSHKGREYLIEIQDIDKPKVVVTGGAQWGKTQAIMNRLFHRIDTRGWSALVLLPTMDEVSDFSQGKFREAYEGSERLQSLFADVNNVNYKRTTGGQEVYLRGTQKLNKMVGLAVNMVFTDEFDHCVVDNVNAAMERMTGKAAKDREDVKSSNPTIPEYGIESEYERSDRRKYFLRCMYCGKEQALEWPDSIEWREGYPETAKYRCLACKRRWTPIQLGTLIREAQLTDGLGWVPEFPDREVAGFRLSQLYSPTVTAQEIVSAWEIAQGNAGRLANFYRFKLGVGYVAEGAQLTAEILKAATGDYSMLGRATRAFAGVDVGAKIHMEVADFPNGFEGQKRVLWAGVLNDFGEVAARLQQFNVRRCVVDAMPERREVERLKEQFYGVVYAAFYPVMRETDTWDDTQRHVKLNRTFWLDEVTARFRTGAVVLPKNLPGDYFRHFQNIVRVDEVDNTGNPVSKWVHRGDDHFAHASVYCDAAAKRCAFNWNPAEELVGDPSFEETGFMGEREFVEVGPFRDDWLEGWQGDW